MLVQSLEAVACPKFVAMVAASPRQRQDWRRLSHLLATAEAGTATVVMAMGDGLGGRGFANSVERLRERHAVVRGWWSRMLKFIRIGFHEKLRVSRLHPQDGFRDSRGRLRHMFRELFVERVTIQRLQAKVAGVLARRPVDRRRIFGFILQMLGGSVANVVHFAQVFRAIVLGQLFPFELQLVCRAEVQPIQVALRR